MKREKPASAAAPKQPANWDPIVNGLWRPPAPPGNTAASAPAPAEPPKYDYDRDDSWKSYVLPSGDISPTPTSGNRRWWGPV
jgi:hypothetical protein